MEKEFSHHDAVPRDVSLEIADVFETLFPNLFAYKLWRQLLFCQKFGMPPGTTVITTDQPVERSRGNAAIFEGWRVLLG